MSSPSPVRGLSAARGVAGSEVLRTDVATLDRLPESVSCNFSEELRNRPTPSRNGPTRKSNNPTQVERMRNRFIQHDILGDVSPPRHAQVTSHPPSMMWSR